MRTIILAAAAFAALGLAPAANAQNAARGADPFTGTWGFQTEDYGNDNFGAIMSGVAVITPASSANHYAVQLLAQELITQRQTDATHLIVARETCTGELVSGQFTLACRMAEPIDGYQPDGFILQQGDADQLVGVLSSATSGQVTFTRMR
jgi:hypothetical protein